jgi:Icc-related predicted phosphoesterase
MKVEMAGGQPTLAPVRSTSVRHLIERVQLQPVLSLHGHIHESRAAREIGRTVAINPCSARTPKASFRA